jgi:hypothetical protein
MADAELLASSILEYGKAAADAYLDSQIATGTALRFSGIQGLYMHALVNKISLEIGPRIAREVLPPASAAIVEQRYPAAVLLRHALMQEGYLGASGLNG